MYRRNEWLIVVALFMIKHDCVVLLQTDFFLVKKKSIWRYIHHRYYSPVDLLIKNSAQKKLG